MIYNKSLQGRFVSGRFVPLMLVAVSVLMWLVGIFFDRPVNDVCIFGLQIENVVSRGITFACFALATAMMSSWYVFDRRIRWFLPLTFFLPSVSLSVHGCVEPALSLLLVLLVQYRLFSCIQGADNRYSLFAASMLLGLAIMLFPQCIMLLCPFFLYITIMSLVRVKEFFSILLGVLTPFWFLWALDYIFPGIMGGESLSVAPMAYIASVSLQVPTLHNALVMIVELLVLVPFVLCFANSSTPAKPLLRKRLRYFALLSLYLVLLSVLYSNDFVLYFIWNLPIMGIMLTYVLSLGLTRLSRFYFVVISAMLLAMIPFSLWLRYL